MNQCRDPAAVRMVTATVTVMDAKNQEEDNLIDRPMKPLIVSKRSFASIPPCSARTKATRKI